jgi:predicted CoA-binding protein
MSETPSTWSAPSARDRLALLKRSRTVAIVGASDNPARASYFVGTYLLASTDYTVWFVNPRAETIHGQRAYAQLSDLPESPDIVDVFRKVSDLPEVLEEARAVEARALWLQLGISDDAIAQQAHGAGMDVVMNRCLKIEHARFHGGLHLAGFNTGVISSRRRLV